MRVIAGRFRGRRLGSVRARGLRPTSDRVREAIFDILGETTGGARVLDLYAGTGALALEALSRGSDGATCVERNPAALAVLTRNIAELGVEERVIVVCAAALDYCRRVVQDEAEFDMVFCDPPYATELTPVRDRVVAAGWWTTVCVVEHAAKRRLPEPWPLPGDTRRYGDTAVTFFWRS